MDIQDRIDICETIYGKMTKVFNKFYWNSNRYHFVNVETGEDMIQHVDHQNEQYQRRIDWINREYVKVMKRGVAIKDKDGYIVLYGTSCEPILKVETNYLGANNVKEYIAENGKLAIYLFGNKTVSSGMRIGIVDLQEEKMIQFLDNVVRLFESKDTLKIVTLDDGEFSSKQYSL